MKKFELANIKLKDKDSTEKPTRKNLYYWPLECKSPEDILTDLPSATEYQLVVSPPSICSYDIVLPRLLVEYKKTDQGKLKALNQLRMYLVAAVKFLAALDIYEYPVYGLATEGKIGRLIMAWTSATEPHVTILIHML